MQSCVRRQSLLRRGVPTRPMATHGSPACLEGLGGWHPAGQLAAAGSCHLQQQSRHIRLAAQVLVQDMYLHDYDPNAEQHTRQLLASWAYAYSSQVSLDFPHALVMERSAADCLPPERNSAKNSRTMSSFAASVSLQVPLSPAARLGHWRA